MPRRKAPGRKIVFKHRRAVGDALLFTCGIRDFKLLFPKININVDSNFPELWENNPYIDWSVRKTDPGVEYYEVGYPAIQTCNNGSIHFTQAFLLDMISQADAHKPLGISVGEFTAAFSNGGEKDLGEGEGAKEPFITWRQKYKDICKTAFRQWGDLHLSDEEKSYNMIADAYGVEKYWVVAPGGKSDCTTKIWDYRKFQKVVDHFDGLIKFVTIGRSDHILEKLDNVIDLTDKTKNIRELVPLVYHSEGCVSGVSFLMHLAAAVPAKAGRSRKPCVSIYGGREPTSFTWYCNHQILHTNGAISCCDNGGCWQSRVIPVGKSPERNNRLCNHTVTRDGRTVQLCMDMISAEDVIRAIEMYYSGGLYHFDKPIESRRKIDSIVAEKPKNPKIDIKTGKEINVLASLQSKGGGEQSVCMIVKLLQDNGWKVHLYPWANVNSKYQEGEYKELPIMKESFSDGNMLKKMKPDLPLLFYANDQIWDFSDQAKTDALIAKSSMVIIGINYCNGSLPKATWLSKTGKVRAIIFQNQEKRAEFIRDSLGFQDAELISMFGAISLDSCLEVPQMHREGNDDLVILRHGMPDYRKYTTEKSVGNGERIHVWQKNIIFETDIKFYERLVKDIKGIRFEFMEAHPELSNHFKGHEKFKFYKFDDVPVTDFLGRGHVYLHRTSRMWRDQYPRSVAEALAAGLPILGEPRDGVKDRIVHGSTGFYCVDYDGFLYALKLLRRKEKYRFAMGVEAKRWAKENLDPKEWVRTLARIVGV